MRGLTAGASEGRQAGDEPVCFNGGGREEESALPWMAIIHVWLNKLTGIGNITNTYWAPIIQILHLKSIPNTWQ
jgi:hypothetical protein